MRDLLIALRPDWLALKGWVLSGPIKKKFGALVQIGVLIWVASMIGVGTSKAVVFARDAFAGYPDLLSMIELNLLSSVSLAGFVMLLMTGIREIYASFYESKDLSYLLSTPLRVEAVFSARLIKSILTGFVLLMPFIGAVWIGYGAAYRLGVLYYPVALISLLLVSAMFTALSSLLVMLIMRFVPGQRMKQVVLVTSLAVSAVFVFVVQYVSSRANTPGDTLALLEASGRWRLGKMDYLPHVWMAKTLLVFTGRFEYSLLESLVPLAAVSLISIFTAGVLARYTFLTGWSSSQVFEGRRRRPSSHAGLERAADRREGSAVARRAEGRRAQDDSEAAVSLGKGGGGAFLAVLRKDLVVLLRTPTMWYSIVVVLIVMGFMAFNMSQTMGDAGLSGAGGPGDAESGDAIVIKTMLLFMALLMSATISARSGAVSVSLEGESWWMIQGMPIHPGAYYWSKLLYSFLTSSAVSLLVMLVISFVPQVPTYPPYISVPVIITVGFALAALSLLLDILSPSFDLGAELSRSPGSQRNVGLGKIMAVFAGSMIIVAVFVAAFTFPVYYSHISLFAWMSPFIAKVAAGVVFVGLAVAVNWVCYAMGTKKLSQMFIGA